MKIRILAFVTTFVVLAMSPIGPNPAHAGDNDVQKCSIKDTPLPPGLTVRPPETDVPKEFSRFVGIWTNGRWFESGPEPIPERCATLVVLHVDEYGNAQIIYSWGDSPEGEEPEADWVRKNATISGEGHMVVDPFKGFGYAAYQFEAEETCPLLEGEFHQEDGLDFYIHPPLRKLNALKKSVGPKIGFRAFADWLRTQPEPGEMADKNAEQIAAVLEPLVQSKKLRIRRGGYLVTRGRGRVIVAPAGEKV